MTTRTYVLHLTVTVSDIEEVGDTRPERESGVATYLAAALGERLESGDVVDEIVAYELSDEPYDEPTRRPRKRRSFEHFDAE